jgi:hypothetical protein
VKVFRGHPVSELCLREEASCQCVRPKRHKPPHRCRCEGEWWINRKGEFIIYELPNPMSTFSILGADDYFGRLGEDNAT